MFIELTEHRTKNIAQINTWIVDAFVPDLHGTKIVTRGGGHIIVTESIEEIKDIYFLLHNQLPSHERFHPFGTMKFRADLKKSGKQIELLRKWQDLSAVIFNNFGFGHGHTKSNKIEEKIGIKEIFERFRSMIESLGLKEIPETFHANLSDLGLEMDDQGEYRIPDSIGENNHSEGRVAKESE
jgi:hypothetical protein